MKLLTVALTLLLLVTQALAYTEFCKCECFGEYEIIELRPQKEQLLTCNNCTRAFCLDQKLTICKEAKGEVDVTTSCFERESFKDQLIVYAFAGVTIGLLLWALVRPVLGRFRGGNMRT